MRLEGKVTLITGAGSGFGRETALCFAREGARVVVADINGSAAEQTAAEIEEAGGAALALTVDVSNAADCGQMIDRAVSKFGGLDVLHNNAGIAQVMTPIEDVAEDVWDRVMSVNLKSVFLCSKAAIPVMKKKGGAIINTSSVGAIRARPGAGAYAVAKAGVTHFTRLLAIELAPYKIRVNSISPVISETPLGLELIPDHMKANMEKTRAAFLATIPMGRMALPKDVANAALFLAADDSYMVTGLDLVVDGGRSI